MAGDDRQALVACEETDPAATPPPARRAPSAADQLPWIFAVAYRRPAPSGGATRLALLSALLVALAALLLVQLALLRDASRAAGVGAYPAALALALLTAVLALPAGAVARWRGGRPAPPARLAAAAALCALGGLLVLAGRHRNRLGCNVQDPLVAVLIVFAFMGHLLTASKLRLRSTIAQVIICLGLFIGVSYQACNKYRCHGDDRSGSWQADPVADREQHALWVAAGTAGLAMICGASLLLEAHFHRQRKDCKTNSSTWVDDIVSTSVMTMASFVVIALLFWIDLIPGVGESPDADKLGEALQKSFGALSSAHPNYLRSCVIISVTSACATLLAVRLLSAGRPTFQLATLATLGVLASELWWSVSRVDGTGGWILQVRMTGEAVMAVVGGLLMVGGLVAWLTFGEKKPSDSEPHRTMREFDVYRVQGDAVGNVTKYHWVQPDIAGAE